MILNDSANDDKTFQLFIAEDQNYNIKIIRRYLEGSGYKYTIAKDGNEALQKLQETPEKFDVAILDRIMPGMEGLDVLKEMKKHPVLSKIPVIFQTSLSEEKEIRDGIEAGAYYYLTKPYEKELLLSIIKAAIADFSSYKSLEAEVQNILDVIGLMKSGTFEFRSLKDGYNLATQLAKICPNPSKTVIGLWELFANAVEHGNLGITYEEKSLLNQANKWDDEIERRMKLDEYKEKKVIVQFERFDEKIQFHIYDQGKGFDAQHYLEFSAERIFDTHGRGIAMAKTFSFDIIEYLGKGNEVIATIKSG